MRVEWHAGFADERDHGLHLVAQAGAAIALLLGPGRDRSRTVAQQAVHDVFIQGRVDRDPAQLHRPGIIDLGRLQHMAGENGILAHYRVFDLERVAHAHIGGDDRRGDAAVIDALLQAAFALQEADVGRGQFVDHLLAA